MTGEFEPNDSRNITGEASTPDGRWTNPSGKTPKPGETQGIGQQRAEELGLTDPSTGQQAGDQRAAGAPGDAQIRDDSPQGMGEPPEGSEWSAQTGGPVQGTVDANGNQGGGSVGGGSTADNSGTESSQAQPGQLNTSPGQAAMGQAIDGGWPDQMQGGTAGGEPGRDQVGSSDSSLAAQIQEHMTVVDAQGQHVGTVDAVENDQIKLTRNESPDGQHHYIPFERVAWVEDGCIRLHEGGSSGFGANGS